MIEFPVLAIATNPYPKPVNLLTTNFKKWNHTLFYLSLVFNYYIPLSSKLEEGGKRKEKLISSIQNLVNQFNWYAGNFLKSYLHIKNGQHLTKLKLLHFDVKVSEI